MTSTQKTTRNTRRLKVYAIDDNPTFLHAIVNFLNRDKRIVIVGTATNAETAIAEVGELKPRVILLDLAMPGMNGLEAIPFLHQALPQTKIIILTLLDTANDRQAAFSAGADDFVTKAEMLTQLMPAIGRVLGSKQQLNPVRRRRKNGFKNGKESVHHV